jgi:hypothetical protein
MVPVTRRVALVIVALTVLAAVDAVVFAIAPAPPAAVIVRNVDGPTVSVEVAGLPPATVKCPGYQMISVSHRNLVPGDVVVADARTGVVLREVPIWGDIGLLIRGTTVLTEEPNPLAPSGPPSTTCSL